MSGSVAAFWEELVTTALLGTDRRDPPEPPPGPLADTVADATRPTASGRMLAAAAACTAVRRAGITPLAPAVQLAPPEPDGRPMVPASTAERWRYVVAHWPVLEDEWLDWVAGGGWRLVPDLLVALLLRHRADPVRRARVDALGGAMVPWLVGHRPELAATRPPLDTGTRPPLAVGPDLAPLLGGEPGAVAATIASRLSSAAFGPPHRAVLVNFVAGVRADALPLLADALRTVNPASPSAGLAYALADLATTRHEMLAELRP
jgi:hypothetical protein